MDEYQDVRSRRRPCNRRAKQSAKYYGYRGVHPSWVNQPYFDFSARIQTPESEWAYQYPNLHASMDPLLLVGSSHATGSSPAPTVATWTKRDMWNDRENDIWPLDRRHHVGKKIREKRSRKWDELGLGRRMRQRNREWEFAVEDARDMARLRYDDTDTVYWELEDRDGQWDWDDVEVAYNEQGESPPERIDLGGERFFGAWFENGNGGFWDDSDAEARDGQEQHDFDFVWLEDASDEDDYFIVSAEEGDDIALVLPIDSDFEIL
jgi:hypothetical protein